MLTSISKKGKLNNFLR
uniref:Uncharacterized protein n=1 Tax=Arundo donax TaxID=35708 RepID=A0A0A9FZR1_ARUDO